MPALIRRDTLRRLGRLSSPLTPRAQQHLGPLTPPRAAGSCSTCALLPWGRLLFSG